MDYDAIVIIPGDGLTYEINGFTEHENPRAAFVIPLAPVPTGSGCGFCLSLMGLKVTTDSSSYSSSSVVDINVACLIQDGLDPALATPNVIKWKYMRTVDEQSRTCLHPRVSWRIWTSIRSICSGWVACGSYTGSFAAVRSSISSTLLPALHLLHFVVTWQRPFPIKISLQVSERDKLKMHENYESSWHEQVEGQKTCWDDLDPSEKLLAVKHSETDTVG